MRAGCPRFLSCCALVLALLVMPQAGAVVSYEQNESGKGFVGSEVESATDRLPDEELVTASDLDQVLAL